MSAIVTRRHREIAYKCVWIDAPYLGERAWVETGENPSAAGPRLVRAAQVIADFEVEVRRAVTEDM